MTNATNCDLGAQHALEQVEQAITADRQQLQAEIEKAVNADLIRPREPNLITASFQEGMRAVLSFVQFIFAGPDSPEEKPEESIAELRTYKLITQAESDRRVLAEREACIDFLEAQIKGYEVLIKHSSLSNLSHKQSLESTIHGLRETVKQIRSRSNSSPASEPKEEAEESAKKKKPITPINTTLINPHPFVALADRSDYCETCKTWKGEIWHLSPLPTIDASDRIALLTQIIGEQQTRITQLEKENNSNELAQRLEMLEPARIIVISLHRLATDNCLCAICKDSRPNNRKA